MTVEPFSDEDWRALSAAVKRVARARGLDHTTTEDVAQETLTRLLAVGDRLEPAARLPYALTTAGNLIVTMHRKADVARRRQPQLLDLSSPHPENDVLALEEAAAIRVALDGLAVSDRRLLVRHVEGSTTLDLAHAEGSSPGAIAARLARTRARLRLDYLLALRRVELPTPSCRMILLAVSAADLRRQRALDAAGHLSKCTTCVDLLPPLHLRKSGLAGIAAAPLVLLGGVGGRLAAAAGGTPVQAAAAATTTAVAVGAGIFAAQSSPKAVAAAPPRVTAAASPAAAIPADVRTATGVNLMPIPAPGVLQSYAGQKVFVSGAIVQSVVSHPGFWVGTASNRLYVHLDNIDLIRQPIRAGRSVSFTAVLERNPSDYATSDGVDIDEGAGLLTAQGVHLVVNARAVKER